MTWKENIDAAGGNMHTLGITRGQYASRRRFGNYQRAIRAGFCTTKPDTYYLILEELKKTLLQPLKTFLESRSDTLTRRLEEGSRE